MNIGLFTDTYYPEINGVANSVYVLKQSLEAKGHNVYVFTTTTKCAPEHEFNVFRVHSLPFVFMPDRRVGLMYQPKYASMIRKLNLDVIHTHTEFSLRFFACIMAKELNIPLVHTYHTIYEDYTHYFAPFKSWDNKAKAFARNYTRRVCNDVAQVIVPTLKTKELLETYSVYKDINVIPTGINLDKFQPSLFTEDEVKQLRKDHNIPLNAKVLLYLGRVSQEKNIGEIISALPDLVQKHNDIRMVIIGTGPDMEHLEQLREELHLEESVIFLGEKPWDDIGRYYQLGDVFVSASQSETQGLTYIEAMASGLPVVAKKDPCLDEILTEGYNGYTFLEKEQLIEGIENVLYSDSQVSFRKNSLEVAGKYAVDTFGDRVESVYQKIICEHEALVEL